MDELNAIDNLAKLANAEITPDTNVSFTIKNQIINIRPSQTSKLSIFAKVSAVAAMLVLSAGILFWYASSGSTQAIQPEMTELFPDTQQIGALW